MPDGVKSASLKTRLESWQPTVDLIRSAFLLLFVVGLLLTLLIYPKGFWSLVNRSGFDVEEIDLPVIGKLTRAKSNVDLAAALSDAKLTNGRLQADLKATSDSLSKLNNCFTTSEKLTACAKDKDLRGQLVVQEKNLQEFQATAVKASSAIDNTLQSNASVIKQSQLAIGGNSWGVVFGGDVSRQAAEDEIKKASKLDIKDLAIYHRQGSYRSLAVFDSRDGAKAALATLRQVNSGAYVVPLDRWCSGAQQVSSSSNRYSFYECGS